MTVTIEKGEGNYIMVSFTYGYDKVSEIKRIQGSTWNALKEAWLVPNTKKNIDEISLAFCDEDIIFHSYVELFDMFGI